MKKILALAILALAIPGMAQLNSAPPPNGAYCSNAGNLIPAITPLTCDTYGNLQLFTLTTTGSSGAATYSGNVLNIPQYSGGSGGSGTVNAGTTGQAAVYSGSGTTVAGATLGLVGGGTGATTAAAALANLGAVGNNTPPWLQYLGTGADGSYEATAASCTLAAPCLLSGEKYYTSFTVDSGAYVYSNGSTLGGGLVVHSQGACNVYGTVLATGARNTWNQNKGIGGASAGGSGGGTAVGTVGYATEINASLTGFGFTSGGTAGTASGGNGGNGASYVVQFQRAFLNSNAGGADGLFTTGATGTQGGSTGGTGGLGGSGIVMMCGSINGTGGVIDASAAYGNPPSANATGAGSGGGGGLVILSSEAAVATWPTIYVAGGPGGLVTVPEALATSGSCTTQPKATLGVTSGALNGTCTVVQAGAGCGTGAGINWNVVGGGGTLGTGTVNPTWSGGALASCTTTAGTSSGYTSATYITAGTGVDGGNGWIAEFAGW
jgi:hypothetical protein